jgi:hypothetical protein
VVIFCFSSSEKRTVKVTLRGKSGNTMLLLDGVGSVRAKPAIRFNYFGEHFNYAKEKDNHTIKAASIRIVL